MPFGNIFFDQGQGPAGVAKAPIEYRKKYLHSSVIDGLKENVFTQSILPE